MRKEMTCLKVERMWYDPDRFCESKAGAVSVEVRGVSLVSHRKCPHNGDMDQDADFNIRVIKGDDLWDIQPGQVVTLTIE